MTTSDQMSVDQFMTAISGQESGGNYNSTNPDSGASGRFQILPANWPAWAAEAGLGGHAPMTPENQDKVARFKMQQYYDQFGSWEAVAVAWYAGPSAAARWVTDPSAAEFQHPQGKYPSINGYVDSVLGGSHPTQPGPVLPANAAAPGAAQRGVSTGSQGVKLVVGADGAVQVQAAQLPPDATPDQIDAYIRANYGFAAGLLDIPEIHDVLYNAAKNGWDEARLKGAVYATDWWKTHSDTARQWVTLTTTDPATAKQQVSARMVDIANIAEPLGLNFGGLSGLQDVATQSLMEGWSDVEIKRRIGEQLRHQSQVRGLEGTGANLADTLQAKASQDWMVPLTRSQAEDWAIRMTEGSASQEGFDSFLRSQAEGRFGWMRGEIQQGTTPGQYFAPIKTLVAQELELNPGDVNLMDPRWSAVVDYVDEQGHHRGMTYYEAQRWARSQPEWRFTQGGQQQAAQLGSELLKRFGAVA